MTATLVRYRVLGLMSSLAMITYLDRATIAGKKYILVVQAEMKVHWFEELANDVYASTFYDKTTLRFDRTVGKFYFQDLDRSVWFQHQCRRLLTRQSIPARD